MNKKMKGVSYDSNLLHGFGLYQDAKSSFKHEVLLQEYQELQKEVDVMIHKLDAAKQRKLTLVAEVRFLRRRYKWLKKMKTMNSSQEQLVRSLNLVNHTENKKEQFFSRTGTTTDEVPYIPGAKLKTKLSIRKEAVLHDASTFNGLKRGQILNGVKGANNYSSLLLSDMDSRGGISSGNKTFVQMAATPLDMDQKEVTYQANDISRQNSTIYFDLNHASDLRGREASLPTRAPLFDLNEISIGDEDFQSNSILLNFKQVKNGLIRVTNDEQNDLKLSMCRNGRESSSHAGKRKISWQDPVALSF